jgi:hypothetical protein
MSQNQPRIVAIEYTWTDPWTEEFCAGAKLAYSRQRMMAGFYRKHALAQKASAQQFTGPRKPKLTVKVHRTG